MTFPISGSQAGGPRGVGSSGAAAETTPVAGSPSLPRLASPSSDAASAREVNAALDAANQRVGAMMAQTSSPEAIMRLLSEVTRGNERDQLGQIAQRSNERQEANRAQQAAIQQAITEQNSSSFWGDVAKVFSYVGAGLAIAGSIAALPFSGGASALGVVCAVTALSASATSLGLQVASDAGAKIPMELTLTVACVGLVAGGIGAVAGAVQLASSATRVATTVQGALKTATGILSTATGVAGSVTQGMLAGAGLATAYHASEAINHRADATQADARVREAQYRITSLIDGLSQNEATRQKFTRRALSMENNRHETAMQAIRA